MRVLIVIFACCLAVPLLAHDDGSEWIGMAARDLQHSQITLPGSKPFHIKAAIVEVENPDSDFKTTIEEYWASPDRWRRIIENPAFSQTLIVNGDKTLESNKGDYYPGWLSDLVTATFEPLPLSLPKNLDPRSTVPVPSTIASLCTSVKTPNDTWSLCFDPRLGVIASVFSKETGYAAEFHNFREFEKKQVPREIDSFPAPGLRLRETITQLEPLERPDDQMFVIETSTPPQGRITTVRVTEETLRSLALSDTKIDWPPVPAGPLKGGCAVYASGDRSGHVREAWPGGCDNAGLEDRLDDIVRKWQLKVATSNGVPVQVRARLTFPFTTTLAGNPMPVLSDVDARALATNILEPIFSPGSGASGTEIIVRVSVDETGKFAGCSNTHDLPTAVFLAADQAVSHWHFKPYIKDGEPESFYADIIFRIP